MGDGLIGRVTSKELKKFPMELGFFEKLRIFQVGGVWGFFIIVEAILGWLKLLREVMFFRFLVDWDFLFLMVGGRLIFARGLRFLMRLRYSQWLEFLVRVFEIIQVVAGGGGVRVTFFLEVIKFLGGRIHLKISILSWRSFIMHTPKRTKL